MTTDVPDVTDAAPAQVIRHSAVAAAHAALGARWISDAVRWPAGYGTADDEADRALVAAGAGLAEIGPLDDWLLRGPGAHAAAAGLAAAGTAAIVGRAVAADLGKKDRARNAAIWFLGPDEILLVAPLGGSAVGAAATALASDDVSVIEMTGARTTLRLAGPAAPAILAELCAADTTPETMAPGTLIQAPFAAVRAFIVREDSGGQPGYTIMVSRDEATYVWDAVLHTGAAHGLAAVGPAAVAADATRAADADRGGAR